MSTTPPPEQPGSQQPGGYGYGRGTGPTINLSAIWPTPGNAELVVWIVVELILALIWIIAKSVDTRQWVIYTTVLTSFYILSRGIAKASRVLEQ